MSTQPMGVKKKRQFTRIQFNREVLLKFYEGEYAPRRLKDLSLTGMYVFGSFNQQCGDICQAHLFQKSVSTLLEIHASAKVIWINDEGLAIQFTSMAYDSYMYLQTTLLYEAGNPLLMGLELPDNCPFELIDIG